MTDKQKTLIEALKVLKNHCMPLDKCEGCELEYVCELLFEKNVEEWELDNN